MLWELPIQPVFYELSDCGAVDGDIRPLESFRIIDTGGVGIRVIPRRYVVNNQPQDEMGSWRHTCRSR